MKNIFFFDKKYIFRLAKFSEVKKIMSFLLNNWDNKHILANNKEYFSYQFKNQKKLNIVICINRKNNQIHALHSFIEYSKKKIKKNICGSIVCVDKKQFIPPFLGMEIFKRMLSITKPKTYFGIGTNPKTLIPLIKKYLGHHTGTMDHYYILNQNIKKNNFRIAKINELKFSKNDIKKDKNLKITEIFESKKVKLFIDLSFQFKNLPYKDFRYIKKRYFDHPFFNYRFFCLDKKDKQKKGILICRVVKRNSKSALRIIDFIGNIEILYSINQLCQNILLKENHEYVDLMCVGIKANHLKKSGFIHKSKNDKNIIPDYFQPFIKKNVLIWYEKNQKNLILFKGDADQDTPRIQKV